MPAGFSIVEMLVVVGLFALLLILAVANFGRQAPRTLAERASLELASGLRYARMRSVSECMPVQVVFDPTGQTMTVQADSNTNGIIETNEQMVVTIPSIPGFDWSMSATTGGFDTRGTWLNAQGLTVDLGLTNGMRRRVQVLSSGVVSCQRVTP